MNGTGGCRGALTLADDVIAAKQPQCQCVQSFTQDWPYKASRGEAQYVQTEPARMVVPWIQGHHSQTGEGQGFSPPSSCSLGFRPQLEPGRQETHSALGRQHSPGPLSRNHDRNSQDPPPWVHALFVSRMLLGHPSSLC